MLSWVRHTSSMNPFILRSLIVLGSILGLVAIGAVAFYFWPEHNSDLQKGTPQKVSYAESLRRFTTATTQEKARAVVDSKHTQLLTHGNTTQKAVVMFHGITADPSQFNGLAKHFFDAGYNVYIPLAPHHGTANKKDHGAVTARELVDFVNQSITTATGLGEHVGVVGLSGGGVLATWAGEYRPEVTRVLALSPFYEPAPEKAPKWQLPLLRKLYGWGLIPDTFIEPATEKDAPFSYHALGNYLALVQNLRSKDTGTQLKQLGVVISDSDDQIDLPLAHSLPSAIAKNNNIPFTEAHLPASWQVKHDIVGLGNPEVAARSTLLFTAYFDIYEGRQPKL